MDNVEARKYLSLSVCEDKGLSSWVKSRIREAILTGDYKPGERIDQEILAQTLDVSRTPIREALKGLAVEGLVEFRSYRGVYIPATSAEDVLDIFELRWILEPEIVRQVTSVVPEETLDYLDNLLQQEKPALEGAQDYHSYGNDKEFHDTICRYCRNRLLIETFEQVNNRIGRVRNFAMHQPGSHMNEAHTEHMRILAAIRKRDPDEASSLMEAHLKKSAERITKYFNG